MSGKITLRIGGGSVFVGFTPFISSRGQFISCNGATTRCKAAGHDDATFTVPTTVLGHDLGVSCHIDGAQLGSFVGLGVDPSYRWERSVREVNKTETRRQKKKQSKKKYTMLSTKILVYLHLLNKIFFFSQRTNMKTCNGLLKRRQRAFHSYFLFVVVFSLFLCLFVCVIVCLFVCVFVCCLLSVCFFASLSVCLLLFLCCCVVVV